MLVTIFPGPGNYFRVREMAPATCTASTVGWFQHYENAIDFVRENYAVEDILSPTDFRQVVLRRKTVVQGVASYFLHP